MCLDEDWPNNSGEENTGIFGDSNAENRFVLLKMFKFYFQYKILEFLVILMLIIGLFY